MVGTAASPITGRGSIQRTNPSRQLGESGCDAQTDALLGPTVAWAGAGGLATVEQVLADTAAELRPGGSRAGGSMRSVGHRGSQTAWRLLDPEGGHPRSDDCCPGSIDWEMS